MLQEQPSTTGDPLAVCSPSPDGCGLTDAVFRLVEFHDGDKRGRGAVKLPAYAAYHLVTKLRTVTDLPDLAVLHMHATCLRIRLPASDATARPADCSKLSPDMLSTGRSLAHIPRPTSGLIGAPID